MKKLLLSAALATTIGATAAYADSASGFVVEMTGDAGTAHIVRSGVITPLASGDTLFSGDRIVTRTGGTVDLEFDGCSATLAEASTVVLGSEFCAQVAQAAARQEFVDAAAIGTGADADFILGLNPAAATLAVLAVGGAIAGIVVAATDDDTDEPASP